MNSLNSKLIRPTQPENGFTGLNSGTKAGTKSLRNVPCSSRKVQTQHPQLSPLIDEQLREYTLREIELIAKDHLEMVQNSRKQNREDHEVLVSASILVQMLIQAGVESRVFSPNLTVRLPRQSRGINFKPLKKPIQELYHILKILIRLLFNEAMQRQPELLGTGNDASSNGIRENSGASKIRLTQCLELIERSKADWRINFNVDDFHNRVNGFFGSDSRNSRWKWYRISS